MRAPGLIVATVFMTAMLHPAPAAAEPSDEARGLRAVEAYVGDRLAARERAIDRLTPSAAAEAATDRFVREARAAMHQLLRRLWLTVERSVQGRAGAELGGVATHAAVALERDLAAFESAVAALPGRVRQAVRADGADSEAVRRLSETIDAVKRFAAAIDPEADGGFDSTAKLDRHLRQAIGPLHDGSALAGLKAAPARWFSRRLVEAEAERIGEAQLAAMRRRIEAADLRGEAKQRMVRLLALVERANGQPTLQPRAKATFSQVRDLMDAREAIEEADWLTPPARQALERGMNDAIAGLSDGEAGSPEASIRAMSRAGRLIGRMSLLEPIDDEAMAKLRVALTTAVRHELPRVSEARPAEKRALFSALEALTNTMTAARSIQRVELSLVVLRARNAFTEAYDRLEAALIDELAAAEPGAARAELQHRLDRLQQLHAHVRRLNATPRWIERVARLNRHAASGFKRQLGRLAEDLLDRETHEAASSALATLETQLAWVGAMPHEPLLRHEAAKAEGWPSPMQAERLRHRLAVARSRWAAAWSAGVDPSEPAERLAMLRRLLRAGHRVRRVEGDRFDPARLAAWAGWTAPSGAVTRLKEQLPDSLRRVTDAAGENNWEAVKEHLSGLERALALPWLVHRLEGELGPLIDQAALKPASGFRVIAPPPSRGGYMADRRDAMGWLGLMMRVWGGVPEVSEAATGSAVLERAARHAERVLDRIEGAASGDEGGHAAPVTSVDL